MAEPIDPQLLQCVKEVQERLLKYNDRLPSLEGETEISLCILDSGISSPT